MKREQILALIDWMSQKYAVDVSDILGDSRSPRIVQVRWLTWHVMQASGMSLPEIGKHFGRDHTTILHGLRALQDDPALRATLNDLIDQAKEALSVKLKDGKLPVVGIESVAEEIIEAYTLFSAVDLGMLPRRDGAVANVAMQKLGRLAADAEKILAANKSG